MKGLKRISDKDWLNEPTSAPAPKPKRSQFIAVGPKVLEGAKLIAGACSSTFARRIANALNAYTPDRRGQ